MFGFYFQYFIRLKKSCNKCCLDKADLSFIWFKFWCNAENLNYLPTEQPIKVCNSDNKSYTNERKRKVNKCCYHYFVCVDLKFYLSILKNKQTNRGIKLLVCGLLVLVYMPMETHLPEDLNSKRQRSVSFIFLLLLYSVDGNTKT